MTKRHVEIAGAGFGGLTAAAAFARTGGTTVICSGERLADAMEGRAGTVVVAV